MIPPYNQTKYRKICQNHPACVLLTQAGWFFIEKEKADCKLSEFMIF